MLKIRLRRMGSTHRPFFRVVVSDSRRAPTASALEEVGFYNPSREPAVVSLDLDRIQHWTSHGAQLSAAVRKLVRKGPSAEAAAEPAKPAEAAAAEPVEAEAAPPNQAKAEAAAAEPEAETAKPEAEAAEAAASEPAGSEATQAEPAADESAEESKAKAKEADPA